MSDENICAVEDCPREVRGRGWCMAHYQRWHKHGSPAALKCRECGDTFERITISITAPVCPGCERRPGDTYVGAKGYVWEYVSSDSKFAEMSSDDGRGFEHVAVRQHRLVVARFLDRPLLSNETVHHLNGNPADNRMSNLQLRQGPHGRGHVHECEECGSRNVTHVYLPEEAA